VRTPVNKQLRMLLLFPIALPLWMLGWMMSYEGDRKKQHSTMVRQRNANKDSITIMPIILEDEEQCET
jgi:hypothetical protein